VQHFYRKFLWEKNSIKLYKSCN